MGEYQQACREIDMLHAIHAKRIHTQLAHDIHKPATKSTQSPFQSLAHQVAPSSTLLPTSPLEVLPSHLTTSSIAMTTPQDRARCEARSQPIPAPQSLPSLGPLLSFSAVTDNN